jgi:riboflavin biosynthesis pyrimidine reductase
MVSKTLIQLFPLPGGEVSLAGLYLKEALFRRGTFERPFVYGNFLTSLDGRIALEDEKGMAYTPSSLTTSDDFRLFLELQAQADCLITHGGYLRALDAGRLGSILQVGTHTAGMDLPEWRRQQGLSAQPAVVIASASLDFPLPESLKAHDQKVYIATGADAPEARLNFWRKQGIEVLVVGRGALVDGDLLTRALGDRGYRTLYLIAGPQMLETMTRESCLAVLFQTITHQLMGGEAFRTLVPGPVLGPFGHLKLVTLFYDQAGSNGAGQWFAQFKTINGRIDSP